MRKIAANFIFPVISSPIKNGVLIIDNNEVITEIIDEGENFSEQANLEFYNGILVPGFIYSTNNSLHKSLNKTNQQLLDAIFISLTKDPNLTFEELLNNYTQKKAKSLKCEDKFGSFEAGKSPGVNLISPFDFQNLTLKKESKIKQLI